MTDSTLLALSTRFLPAIAPALPAVIPPRTNASFAWDEFFAAQIANPRTRAAYSIAARQFFRWLEPQAIALSRITPAIVGAYFAGHPGSAPTRKVHLAALRGLFDCLVVRHAIPLNPAASVRGPKYRVVEGKTPEIGPQQVQTLLRSIPLANQRRDGTVVPLAVGLRDRALIGVLIYTAARAGAVAKLRLRDFIHDGALWTLRFDEKGGLSREIPVRHDDLEKYILAYLDAAGIAGGAADSPLFRAAERRTGRLTPRPMTNVDVCRMVKRRLKDAGLPPQFSPHSFRVTTVTDLLTQGVPLEDVQHLAGHADPRTTRLYDRRQKRVTRNIVERISIYTLAKLRRDDDDPADIKRYSSREAVAILNRQLKKYFSQQGDGERKSSKQVRVILSDDIIADAAAGADVIRIHKDRKFSERDLKIFEVHEAQVHVATTLNGLAQPVCTFLSKGPPSSTVNQEGLAIIMEIFTFSSYPHRVQRLTDRITAIHMAEQGANFIEVFNFFIDQGLSEDESYSSTRRVFRGSTPTGGPFTKDLSYSKGFVLIYNYIRLAIQNGVQEYIPLLFLGKTTLEDLHIFADLMEGGVVIPPIYLPPQFKDLAALSAWMSYSLFLNKLSLEKLAIDYKVFLRT